jgi:hypothetical protein
MSTMPTELQDALEETIREHKLVFGLIASISGDILATAGNLSDKAFRWLVGPTPQHWLCTEPEALQARYAWLSECEDNGTGLLPRMTRQGDCFLAWMKPRSGVLAVIGLRNRALAQDVLRLHQVCQDIDATLKRLLAAEGA